MDKERFKEAVDSAKQRISEGEEFLEEAMSFCKGTPIEDRLISISNQLEDLRFSIYLEVSAWEKEQKSAEAAFDGEAV